LIKGIKVFSIIVYESRLWSLEIIRKQDKTLIIAGDNDSNILLFRDSSKEEKLI